MWKSRIHAIIFLALLFLPPAGNAITLQSQTPIIWGVQNLYSPTVLENKLWIGGWKDVGQSQDAIYISEFNGTAWTSPALVFRKPGWHVNDPTIIKPPSTDGIDRSKWLYMYYTGLDLSACTPIELCQNTDNVVGFASSIDGGYTWTDHEVLIHKQNGLDNCGAWSPSALVVDSHISLYFHGAVGHGGCPASVYRFTVNANGWQITNRATTTLPRFIDNIDVLRAADGTYIMIGNSPELQAVYRYVSKDGVRFTVPSDNLSDAPLIASQAHLVLTPHVTLSRPDAQKKQQLNVWFSLTPNVSACCGPTEIHKWTWWP
jgi:hypothetical protein